LNWIILYLNYIFNYCWIFFWFFFFWNVFLWLRISQTVGNKHPQHLPQILHKCFMLHLLNCGYIETRAVCGVQIRLSSMPRYNFFKISDWWQTNGSIFIFLYSFFFNFLFIGVMCICLKSAKISMKFSKMKQMMKLLGKLTNYATT